MQGSAGIQKVCAIFLDLKPFERKKKKKENDLHILRERFFCTPLFCKTHVTYLHSLVYLFGTFHTCTNQSALYIHLRILTKPLALWGSCSVLTSLLRWFYSQEQPVRQSQTSASVWSLWVAHTWLYLYCMHLFCKENTHNFKTTTDCMLDTNRSFIS